MLLRTLTLNPVEPRAKSASCLGKGLAEQNVLPHRGVENPGLLWRKGDWLLPGDLPSHERSREFEIRLSSHWYSILLIHYRRIKAPSFFDLFLSMKRRTSFERSRFFDRFRTWAGPEVSLRGISPSTFRRKGWQNVARTL